MSRLRDDISTDLVLSEAAALLRAVAPSDKSDAMQARVWLQLRTRRRRSPRLLGLRPALASCLLLVLGALAGATVMRGWRKHQAAIAPSPIPPDRVRHRHRARAAADAPTLPPETPLVFEPTVIELPPASTAPPGRAASSAAVTHATHVAPSESDAVPRPSIAPPEAATTTNKRTEAPEALLQSAMRALRFEHDAQRAGELAGTYLARYPEDDLVEEAMAIAIEAHEQLDDGRAHALASRYLMRFPNGRFRATALHAF